MEKRKTLKIKKNALMWAVIGILLIAAIFLTVKAASIGQASSGAEGSQLQQGTGYANADSGSGSASASQGYSAGAPSQVGGC